MTKTGRMIGGIFVLGLAVAALYQCYSSLESTAYLRDSILNYVLETRNYKASSDENKDFYDATGLDLSPKDKPDRGIEKILEDRLFQ